MEYRKLPHGGENERFSVLGIGIGGIQSAGAANVYAPFGRAIAGQTRKGVLSAAFRRGV